MTQEDLNSRRFNDLESSRVSRGERSRLSLSVIAVMPLRNESESRVGLPRVRPRVTGPNQSQPGHYHPEDCYSSIYRLPFPAFVCSLFLPNISVCFFLFLFFSPYESQLTLLYQPFGPSGFNGLGMMRMCSAEPHWFRLSVATAEVV